MTSWVRLCWEDVFMSGPSAVPAGRAQKRMWTKNKNIKIYRKLRILINLALYFSSWTCVSAHVNLYMLTDLQCMGMCPHIFKLFLNAAFFNPTTYIVFVDINYKLIHKRIIWRYRLFKACQTNKKHVQWLQNL